eukprot:7907690-Heterocapsa_arctica.AAC.1
MATGPTTLHVYIFAYDVSVSIGCDDGSQETAETPVRLVRQDPVDVVGVRHDQEDERSFIEAAIGVVQDPEPTGN